MKRKRVSICLAAMAVLALLTVISCSNSGSPSAGTSEKLEADKSALELTYSGSDSSSNVTGDLTLPTTGSVNDSAISWSSSATDIVSTSGTVTTPQDDTSVTLTATLTLSGSTATKTFTITVKGADYPVWASGYPKTGAIGETNLKIKLEMGKVGKVYYQISTSAQTLTSAELISAGTLVTISAASTETVITHTGLTAGTAYYAYFVAETTDGTYIQPSVKELTFTTGSFTISQVWETTAMNPSRNGIHVNGDYLYGLAYSGGGIYIWNVSDPESPTSLSAGTVAANSSNEETIVSSTDNSCLYVPYNTSTLNGVYNISDKATPAKVSTSTILGAPYFGATVSGNIYVGIHQSSGVYVYDISTPSIPAQDAEVTGMSYPYNVSISGNTLAVADTTNGLYLYDISTPTSPQKQSLTSVACEQVFVNGSTVYMGTMQSKCNIYDISDPSSPTLLSSSISFGGYGMYADSKYLYLGNGTTGVQIYNIEDPKNPLLLKTYQKTTSTKHAKVMVQNGFLYLAEEGTGVAILKLTGF